jgi:hypothetical protein
MINKPLATAEQHPGDKKQNTRIVTHTIFANMCGTSVNMQLKGTAVTRAKEIT